VGANSKLTSGAQLCSYLDKYTKAIVVHADNVGSNQLMMIRKARSWHCGPAPRRKP